MFGSKRTLPRQSQLCVNLLVQNGRVFLLLHRSWAGGIVLSVQYEERVFRSPMYSGSLVILNMLAHYKTSSKLLHKKSNFCLPMESIIPIERTTAERTVLKTKCKIKTIITPLGDIRNLKV